MTQANKKIPDFPRLSGRFYLFPAILPLVEVVPWVLAALGGLAGAVAGLTPQKLKRLVLAGIAAALVAGAAGAYLYYKPSGEVVMAGTRSIPPADYAGMPAQGSVFDTGALQGPDAISRFDMIWQQRLEKQILSTPLVVDGRLIYGTYQGTIEARTASQGEKLWEGAVGNPLFALVNDRAGHVFAGEGLHETQVAKLTSFDPVHGRILWQREFLGHLEEDARIDEARGLILTGAGPGGLWALHKENGEVRWHAELGHIDSTPLVHDGVVYVLAQPDEAVKESKLFALGVEDGAPQWSLDIPGQPWGSPSLDVARGTIVFTSGLGQIGVDRDTDKGWVQAVSLTTRKIIWQTELASMALQPDVFLQDHDLGIYTLTSGELIALDLGTGKIVWHAKVAKQFQAGAVLLEGAGEPLIAATAYDGTFTIRRALTGEKVARRALGEATTASPVPFGDFVYVPTAYRMTLFGGVDRLRADQP